MALQQKHSAFEAWLEHPFAECVIGGLSKRIVDVFLGFFAMVLAVPIVAFAAVAIKLTSRGPIFFIQQRCGRDGKCFKMLKLRSMVVDAESQMTQMRRLNEMSGPVFKIANDPRLTLIGRWLRKTSIDELPQLLNVLKGEMSLVGPRPPLPSEVLRYEPWQRRRLTVKPGITCIWQTSGRSRIGFDEWVAMDLSYIDHWSLGLDFKLLWKTIRVVLCCKDAY